VELDDADKSAPWQPNPQRELPAPRGQFSRKDRRDVLAQSLEDKSAELRSGYRTASGHGVFNRERSWQLGGARERTPTRPRVCWRTHRRTPGRAPSSCLGPDHAVRRTRGQRQLPASLSCAGASRRPRRRRTTRWAASRYAKCLSRCWTLSSASSGCAATSTQDIACQYVLVVAVLAVPYQGSHSNTYA
jgi:hypothetical protein